MREIRKKSWRAKSKMRRFKLQCCISDTIHLDSTRSVQEDEVGVSYILKRYAELLSSGNMHAPPPNCKTGKLKKRLRQEFDTQIQF